MWTLARKLLAISILALLAPSPARTQTPALLELHDLSASFDCAAIQGQLILLLDRDGATLLSAVEFPGSSTVGHFSSGAVTLDRPIAGRTSYPSNSALPEATAIYGWRVPGVDTEGHNGCIAFDQSRFTWPGDLASYARWLVRDIYLPLDERGWLPGGALHIGGRTIHIEVKPSGYKAVRLKSVEAGIIGLDLPDGRRYFFRPVLLGDDFHAAVLVTRPKGKVYSADGQEVLALARISDQAPTPTASDPDFSIRLLSVDP